MPEPPEYLPLTKAAHVFGVSRPTLYEPIRAGLIRCVRHGCLSLVDMASARSYFGSLPSITVAPPSRAPPKNRGKQ